MHGRHKDLASLDSKTWIYCKEYTSPEIVNEILAVMGNTLLRSIVSDIQSSSGFSIIADEATDISRNEQMSHHWSMPIRWTNDNYQIYEECLGLVQLPDTKADTI